MPVQWKARYSQPVLAPVQRPVERLGISTVRLYASLGASALEAKLSTEVATNVFPVDGAPRANVRVCSIKFYLHFLLDLPQNHCQEYMFKMFLFAAGSCPPRRRWVEMQLRKRLYTYCRNDSQCIGRKKCCYTSWSWRKTCVTPRIRYRRG